jgi:hypothetical protein
MCSTLAHTSRFFILSRSRRAAGTLQSVHEVHDREAHRQFYGFRPGFRARYFRSPRVEVRFYTYTTFTTFISRRVFGNASTFTVARTRYVE